MGDGARIVHRFIIFAYKNAYMGDTSIRLSEEAKHRLELAKREGETFEDVILRLTEDDKWQGFGALSDAEGDTGEGLDRMRSALREEMKRDMTEET